MFRYMVSTLLTMFLCGEMKDDWNPEIKTNNISSPVINMVWCGSSVVYTQDDEKIIQKEVSSKVVFILTFDGIIRSSLDFGQNWVVQHLIMQGNNTFFDIQLSPADSRYIYLFSNKGLSFRSTNCGLNYEEITHERGLMNFKLNQINTELIIALKQCEKELLEVQCKNTSQQQVVSLYLLKLYVTQNGGKNWSNVLSEVKEASWDRSSQNLKIIACHMQDNNMTLSYSDNFFQQKNVLHQPSNGYFQSSSYLFFLTYTSNEQVLMYSNTSLENFTARQIKLPLESVEQYKFTIVDTLEGQIFLSVSHNKLDKKLTNIYISNSLGNDFSLSLLNNVRSLVDGNCDFERIQGINGVYLANIYDHLMVDEAQINGDYEELEQYKKTFISFDRGLKWNPLKAPIVDMFGENIICAGDCSLHLQGRTESQQNLPQSNDASPGLIIGVGNVGLYLSQNQDDLGTYISRDGGQVWNQVAKGSHLSQIGDRGGIIVLAQNDQMTDHFLYSWDQGSTWSEVDLEKRLQIINIDTEQSSNEQTFIIQTNDQEGNSQTISIDFSKLYDKECWGAWDPTIQQSDYELWSLIQDKCVLGRKFSYLRRKQESKCSNKEETILNTIVQNCSCVEEDWTCEEGSSRRFINHLCIPNDQRLYSEPPAECIKYYTKFKGFQKIPSNQCQGGLDLSPIKTPCPEEQPIELNPEIEDLYQQDKIEPYSTSFFMVIGLSFIGIIIVIILKISKRYGSEQKSQQYINVSQSTNETQYKKNQMGTKVGNYGNDEDEEML